MTPANRSSFTKAALRATEEPDSVIMREVQVVAVGVAVRSW